MNFRLQVDDVLYSNLLVLESDPGFVTEQDSVGLPGTKVFLCPPFLICRK